MFIYSPIYKRASSDLLVDSSHAHHSYNWAGAEVRSQEPTKVSQENVRNSAT